LGEAGGLVKSGAGAPHSIKRKSALRRLDEVSPEVIVHLDWDFIE
jgi:hypothetical protein